MEALNEVSENPKKTFMSHVFSTTEESKAEFMNILQYAFLAIIPIVALNKTIHHFIPEADHDKSNLELLVEVLLQVATSSMPSTPSALPLPAETMADGAAAKAAPVPRMEADSTFYTKQGKTAPVIPSTGPRLG